MVSDCARSRTDCPKCKERVEEVSGLTGPGEENVVEIVHKSGACDEMFTGPMRFAKEFTKPGNKKMLRLMMKDPAKKAEADIEYHNKKVGFDVRIVTVVTKRCYINK